jgi:hypothetical protein
MKRLLREPLVHFLLIGAALFVVFGLLGKDTGTVPGAIVITKEQIASLAADFQRTWQRPPTTDEREALIQDRLREEVYYREAMALGLDKDDPIIRRRLRQKMEFISEDVAAQAEPTDAELAAYLSAHPDAFRAEGGVPPLAEIRGAVRREWADAQRLAANEAAYRALLQKYTVTIERQ